MARVNYFSYKMEDENGSVPKRGLIGVEDGVATYKRLLTPKEIEKYGLIDTNGATKLAMYRSAKGMTQLDLSIASGISLRTIQGWELKGMNNVQLSPAIKIADALGVKDLRELMEDETVKP